ncbi:MAG: DUF6273 domain-containing protein [Defluviitaleaceae bacterium]|nr:DUF6273 domain-containing protein [Defluviitaleaceae bacterium]
MHFGGYDWRVLDVENNQALLISEKVLEKRPYNVEYKAITWEQCSLRKYLNNEFYNSLGAENSKIAQTQNPNTNNPWYGTAVGNPTSDKIFLLSIEEVVKYFGDSDDLKNKRRKDIDGNLDSSGYWLYDEYNNARMARDDSGKVWWWWLRSPGSSSYDAAYVRGIGSVRIDGDPVSLDSGGVRPALWLNL